MSDNHKTKSAASDLPELRIAYIGGGSLNWAVRLIGDLAAQNQAGGAGFAADLRLYDLDHAAAERNARLVGRYAAEGAPLRAEASRTLAGALQGADVVVVSILPGRFDDMAQDIAIPERYGVLQAVGDTVGPGGFVRALRAIPMIADIARPIEQYAPNAWVCNLTNPMSTLTGALYSAYPGIRAWGECHEVTKLRQIIAWLANRREGHLRWGFRDVTVNVLGINHFTFVSSASVGGIDMMPVYMEFARERLATGWRATPRDPADEHARYFEDENRVKFDLASRFGIAAAAGDRHLAEFLPQSWYLDRHEAFGFGLTPVDYRKRDQAAKRAQAEALDNGAPLAPAQRSEEALVDQLRALAGQGMHLSNANLPNRGQIPNLPQEAIVETNALFTGLGVQPVVAGALPDALAAVIAPHAMRQTALVAAVMEERWNDLFPLFVTDPLVAPLGTDRARAMYDEMLQATAAHLPEELVQGAA